MTDTRRCVCGATLIPTDQLSVIDTDTVHRHGGPCYVDETRTDVVQRARQALDAWPGQPITDDDRRVNAIIGSVTVAQYDLVRELLEMVEVALPTITTQRDDALAEVADLLKVDHQCAAVDEAWAADRAERDELRATIERVRMLHSKRPVAPGCTTDSEPWPCSTIRALDGES